MAQIKETEISPELIAEAVRKAMAAISQSSGKQSVNTNPANRLDAKRDYPLSEKRPDLVRSATGLKLEEITLEKVMEGKITFDDFKIRPETLEYQAQIAESIGRPHIAANLRRAAELTRIPDERILEIYDALRPYRCTKQELLDIARELESKYDARICAALVREAAEVYEKRGRLKS